MTQPPTVTIVETGMLSVAGRVELDGDCIYVNGMTLANMIRAFVPPIEGAAKFGRIAITMEAVVE